MSIYLINIALIYIWAIFLLAMDSDRFKKGMYCTVVACQWILLSGLRDLSIGADTVAYARHFERIKTVPWDNIFQNILEYVKGAEIKDPGYALVVKVFQVFSGEYQLFLLFIAILFIGSMAVWIYRNSPMPCLSFILFSTLFYSFYAITGHRQTIATALVVFIGYHFIRNRKLIPFLLLSVVAFFIHKSSVCFVPFYFLANVNISWKYVSIFTVLSVAMVTLGTRFYEPLAELIGYEVEIPDTAGTTTYVLMVCVVAFATIVLYKFIKENNPDDYKSIIHATLLTLVFSIMTLQNQGFMRVQQYYALFLMLSLPKLVKCFDAKTKVVVYLLGSAILVFKLVQNHPEYMFFWQ